MSLQKKTKTGELFKKEGTEKGNITFKTYFHYFRAGGNPFTLFWMVTLLIGAQVSGEIIVVYDNTDD